MVFSSETFLFLFLPLILVIYYLTPERWKSVTILVGSYTFYGWWRLDFLGLLALTTLWTYIFGILIHRHMDTPKAKLFCGIGVVGCLTVLGVFKYLNFFIDSFAALWGTTAEGLGIHWQLLLPIGISFYVFHSISYLVDIYRRDAEPTRNIFDFAAFIALFPQLVAGPILRFKDLAPQFIHRTHSVELFSAGATRFVIGLSKKVLLADTVGPIADLAFSHPDPTMAEAWVGAIAYMLQLYFDFAAYSDMAVGLGMMIGFRLIENFDTPYHSRSITEFWRRWHISLSVWLRDYLYVPLGGNRKGVARTYINLFLVMFLGGLWHGANWTFVLWGSWHGAFLVVERYFEWPKKAASSVLALPLTLLAVLIGWVMFRATDVGNGFPIYAGMLGFNGIGFSPDLAWQISREGLLMVVVSIVVVIIEPRLRGAMAAPSPEPLTGGHGAVVATVDHTRSLAMSIGMAVIAALTLMKMAEATYSPFLYFQF